MSGAVPGKLMGARSIPNVIRSLELGMEVSLLVIFVGSPLAFGAVHTLAYRSVQILAVLILILYSVRERLVGLQLKGFMPPFRLRSFLLAHPFVVPLLLWFGWAAVQMVPLPPEFLRSISQNVFEVYATALGSSQLGWRPLSLSVFDTWRALTQAITCGILFYFTAIYRPAFFPGQATKPRGLCSIFWRGPSQDPFLNGLLALAALTAGFEAFYGLGEYLAGHQRIYFFSRSVSAEGAAGTFVNRNHFANYLVLFYPLLFSWLAGGLVSTKQGLPPASSFRGQGLWLAFVLTAVTIAIVVSHSRMAILSSGIAFLFLVASFLWVTPSRKGVLLLLGCSAVAVLFLFFLDPGFASFQSRIHLFFQGYDRSRFRVWQDSFQIVRDVPWTGTGLETFQFIFPKYSSVPITLRFTHGHSDWLELLVETGIPGFLTFALAVMWFFIFYVQRLKHLPATIRPIGVGILISLAAFLIHSSAEFNFHIPANAYSFAIVTGMGVRLFDQARGK